MGLSSVMPGLGSAKTRIGNGGGVLIIVYAQAGVTAIAALLCGLLRPEWLQSAILGGLACALPTVGAIFLLVRPAAGRDPGAQWREMLSIEIRRCVLTLLIFTALFQIESLQIVVFFGVFLACQSMYPLALISVGAPRRLPARAWKSKGGKASTGQSIPASNMPCSGAAKAAHGRLRVPP